MCCDNVTKNKKQSLYISYFYVLYIYIYIYIYIKYDICSCAIDTIDVNLKMICIKLSKI